MIIQACNVRIKPRTPQYRKKPRLAMVVFTLPQVMKNQFAFLYKIAQYFRCIMHLTNNTSI